jgi:hypothetical protein
MNRRHFVSALLASLPIAGCGLFDKKRQGCPATVFPCSGSTAIEADPALASQPITLAADDRQPGMARAGRQSRHTMGNLSLPSQVKKAWEPASARGRALYQGHVAAGHRRGPRFSRWMAGCRSARSMSRAASDSGRSI